MKAKIQYIPSEIPDFVDERDVFGQINPKRIADHRKFMSLINDSPPILNIKYAHLKKRFIAVIVDIAIVAVVFTIVEFVLNVWIPNYYKHIAFQVIAAGVIWILYNGIFDASVFQGTIGKLLFQLKVINQEGKRIHFIQASVRCIMAIFSLLPYISGMLINEKGQRKQMFHDKVLDCYVVDSK